MSIIVIGINEKTPKGYSLIDTTSRSKNFWSRELSPFYLKVPLPNNKNKKGILENIWQYSKVYDEYDFLDQYDNPTDSYFKWRDNGFSLNVAIRYPIRKGAIPVFSYWGKKKLSYIEARKKIYIPLYKEAVVKTDAYKILKGMYENGDNIALRDFDSYNNKKLGMTYNDVINCATRKLGHAFVLAMCLEEGL